MNTALSSALVHSVWQCAAIAAVLGLLMVFVRAAKARYALACFALAAMPLAFGITAWLAMPESSMRVGPRFIASFANVAREGFEFVPTEPSARWSFVSLWIVGVISVGLYRLVGWISAQRLRRRGVCTAPEEWQSRLNELSHTIRSSRSVRLLESTLVEAPLTIGALRPVILMPLGLLAGMPVSQVEAILLHELAHIGRYDYFVNLLQTAVESLLFYHPAVWWVSRVVRREREMCCDDVVIAATKDTMTYAKALAALEQYRSTEFALAAGGAPLILRIHRLLGRPVANGAGAMAAIVFVMLGGGAAMLAFPHPEPVPQDPQPQQQETPVVNPTPASVPAPSAAPRAKSVPSQPSPAPTREQAANEVYTRWMNQEVIWIITPEERAAFGRLQTDDERQRFIEQFWIRRDPTPDTEHNELKEEHYRRVAWANDRFATSIPGWKTDRGMVYVRYGAPDEKETHDATNTQFPYERWRYKYLEGIGSELVLDFVDRTGEGDYRMTWDPADREALLRVPGEGKNIFDRLQLYVNVRPRPAK